MAYTRRLRHLVASALALVLLAALAGCSPRPTGAPAPTNPVRDIATYSAADRLQKIEAGAKQEGTLSWYTSLGLPNAEPLARAFEAKYPFIKVEIFRADGTVILTKVTEEAKAGKPAADIVETTLNSLKPLREDGLLTEFYIPNASAYPPDAKLAGTGNNIYWAVDREHYISFGYNTNLVDPSALPKDLDGLLGSGLKGKMQVVGTATGIEYVGSMLTHKSRDYVRQLGQQDIRVQMVSGTALLDLIAKGEVAASPTVFRAEVKAQQAKGSPVEWIELEPVTANAGGIVFLAGAPHPNAAALFVQFILGDEGQGAYKEMGFGSAGVDPGFRRWYPGLGTTAAQYDDLYQTWSRTMEESFVRPR